ncbi:hypothetical protein PVL29_009801 [Vitis rotundifolia]|uniref:Uncharacterized protein n=1 Tax=Vitis rotundifolia TaxID=103349 RepID=A0AA38ZTC3_VITRO|nr:hypothetical protein PVL29_009801 [Vitis rotundifolia]
MDSRIDAHLSKMETWMDDLTFSVDGGTEVIGCGSNTRAATVAYETMLILQTSGAARQVDGGIFIRATDTGVDIVIQDDPPMVQDAGEAVTPIVEITNQATTLVLEEIDGVVDPTIGS